jgi:hypothetical protein
MATESALATSTGAETGGDTLGPTEVSVRWKEALGGAVKKVDDSLTVELTNNANKETEGRLVLWAAGLDGRSAQRSLGTFKLAARASSAVSVPVSALPVQSEVATSFAQVQVELDRPIGVVRLPTIPLYYIFSGGYAQVELYSDDEVKLLPNGGVRTADIMDVRGRVLDANGTLQEIDSKLAAASGSRTGSLSIPMYMSVEPQEFLAGLPPAAPNSPPDSTSVKVCFQWIVNYTDGGYGEDYLVFNVPQWVKASFAWVGIWDDSGRIYRNTWLDYKGCTPWFPAPADTLLYAMQWTVATGAGVTVDNTNPNGQRTGVFSAFWTPPEGDEEEIYPSPPQNDRAIQSQAASGFILMQSHVRIGQGLEPLLAIDSGGNGYYSLYNLDSPGNTYCVAGGVYLRKSYDGTPASNWKFAIAHELGHCTREKAMGGVAWGADYSSGNDTAAELCKCDHPGQYPPGYTVPAHCLQSRETFGAAGNEGFAQAFASRVFNIDTEANGVLVYYGLFWDGDYEFPPRAFNAYEPTDPESWMRSNCTPGTYVGVEWDWFNFLYTVTSQATASRINLEHYYGIYRCSCNPTTCNVCNSAVNVPVPDMPGWATPDPPSSDLRSLTGTARSFYDRGWFTWQQYSLFAQGGELHGVNY